MAEKIDADQQDARKPMNSTISLFTAIGAVTAAAAAATAIGLYFRCSSQSQQMLALQDRCLNLQLANEQLGTKCFELERQAHRLQAQLTTLAASEQVMRSMYVFAKEHWMQFVVLFVWRGRDPDFGELPHERVNKVQS